MKILPNFLSFRISAKGMSLQKKKMELVTENIANMDTTKTREGTPYKRKFLTVEQKENFRDQLLSTGIKLKLKSNNAAHFSTPEIVNKQDDIASNLKSQVVEDTSQGELVYMPEHPDANEDGYVQMPNVNVVTEMVDMIAASRSFEANLTAFDASKQIAKDSLGI